MAITRIERGGPTIWPWVLALIAAAVAVWLLKEALDGDPQPEAPPAADSTAAIHPA